MRMLNRRMIVVALAALLLLSGVIWAYGYMADQRDAAATAAREAGECTALAERIVAAGKSTAIGTRAIDPHRSIATAAADAGIATLDRIEPGSPRRAVDGETMERPVDVYVRSATLQQVITFLHALASPPNGLRAARLRLTTPDDAAGATWGVETTLTYPVAEEK